MYHTIYKTTNNVNGKIYIGVHSTNDINDNYLGSGQALKAAITKYGELMFSKTILMVCDSISEAYNIEELLVCSTFIKRKDVYNLSVGGKGCRVGYLYLYDESGKMYYLSSEEAKKRPDLKAKKHTKESKIRMREIRIAFLNSLTPNEFDRMFCNKVCTEETRRKMSISQKDIPRRKLTLEEREIRRIMAKEFWSSYSEEERKLKCKTKSVESEDLRRLKISESSRKPKNRSTCPHCNKSGGEGALKRYHFDNCKFKG